MGILLPIFQDFKGLSEHRFCRYVLSLKKRLYKIFDTNQFLQNIIGYVNSFPVNLVPDRYLAQD